MAGDNLGLLLRGIERTDVERGRSSPNRDHHPAQEVHERSVRIEEEKKADGTKHSSPATGRSSTSGPWT